MNEADLPPISRERFPLFPEKKPDGRIPTASSPALRWAFVALLGFNGLFELMAASVMFVDLPSALAMFGIDYTS